MIAVEGVAASYGLPWRRVEALRGLNWDVPTGKTLLLGPNGAGKSTLLKVLCGIARPDSGRVVGLAPDQVGYMPQVVRPVQGLTVHEQVAYCGWLGGMSKGVASRRARECLAQVDLEEFLARPSGALSGGQLRRVGVAEALMSGSELLVLDEPAAGLDPSQRQNLSDLISRLQQSIVVASHQIEDIKETYDQVAVVAAGRVVFDGTVAQFMEADPRGGGDPYRAYAALTGAHDDLRGPR